MWILDAIVEPIWLSRDDRARMGALLGVELRRVSMGVQKEPQGRAGQGRQGRRAATVEEQTSSCWAWLTRCPRRAEAARQRCGEAQVGTVRVAVRRKAGASLLLLLLPLLLLLLHATQSRCVLLVAAVTKKGGSDWGGSRESGQGSRA